MKNQISISMLLILVVSPLTMAFASTESNEDFLNIRETTIDADSDEMSAYLDTHGHIPTNGNGDAFGYGILTREGLDAVVVSTTHAGVQDSEEQTDANDPVWHNHFITLGQDSENCGDDLKVGSITFESPGQIDINDNTADLTQIPGSFSGTDALTGDDLTIKPGTEVDDVISFKLSPQFNDDDELESVCVTDIQSSENIVFENDGSSDTISDSQKNSGGLKESNDASDDIGNQDLDDLNSGGDDKKVNDNLLKKGIGNPGSEGNRDDDDKKVNDNLLKKGIGNPGSEGNRDDDDKKVNLADDNLGDPGTS